MTPRVFLMTAIAGAALVFAVPAFAERTPVQAATGLAFRRMLGEPGAIAAITLEIHALVKSLGFPPGIVDSTFAKLHDGSVEASSRRGGSAPDAGGREPIAERAQLA